MNVNLVSIDPWAPALKICLDRLPAVVGCDPDAVVRITNKWTSAKHCEIYQNDGELYVRDLASEHGVLVNQRPETDCLLASGDTLTIGIRTLQVVCRTSTARPKPSRSNTPHASTAARG